KKKRKEKQLSLDELKEMENYLKGCIIGRGAYGIVYKVTCLKTGKAFALKYIEQKNATIGVEDATLRELSCLSALRGHPNVIQIHDLFMDGENIAMLMPYVPYTLTVIHNGHGLKVDHDLGKALQGIPLSFVAHFSVQVANALSYMHGPACVDLSVFLIHLKLPGFFTFSNKCCPVVSQGTAVTQTLFSAHSVIPHFV
uniref:Protein kinase domain-containing protein n=1 Tax=Sparus aurata TaxID=8175 RepID=A0A671X3J4_SPAAU